MNDKVKLHTQNYKIDYDKFSKILDNKIINSYASNFNLSRADVIQNELSIDHKIAHNDSENFIHLSIHNKGLKIEFNPNKINGKIISNTETLSFPELQYALKYVESFINDLGIIFKIDDCKIFSNHSAFYINDDYNRIIPLIKEIIVIPNNMFIKPLESDTFLLKSANKPKSQKIEFCTYNKTKESQLLENYANMECRNENIISKDRISVYRLNEKTFENKRQKDKEWLHKLVFGNIQNIESFSNQTLFEFAFNESNSNNDIIKYYFANDKSIDVGKLEVNYLNKPKYQQKQKLLNIKKDYKLLETEIMESVLLLETKFLECA